MQQQQKTRLGIVSLIRAWPGIVGLTIDMPINRQNTPYCQLEAGDGQRICRLRKRIVDI